MNQAEERPLLFYTVSQLFRHQKHTFRYIHTLTRHPETFLAQIWLDL